MIDIDERFRGEDGHEHVKITLQSNSLRPLTIDTYQTFSGDSWEESEAEYLQEEYGLTSEELWDANVTYDHKGILHDLAEACAVAVLNHTWDNIIESIKVTGTHSPAYYNFETDSFEAQWTLDWTLLKKWMKKWRKRTGQTRTDWVRENWGSCDGFHSFIYPGRWENPEMHDPMRVWASLAIYLQESLKDEEGWWMEIAEAEWEIYSDHTTRAFTEGSYAQHLTERIREAAGAPEGDIDGALEMLLEHRGLTIEGLMDEYPFDLAEATNKVLDRAPERQIQGQETAF